MSFREDAGELKRRAARHAMVPTRKAPSHRAPKQDGEGQLYHLPLPDSDSGLVAAFRAGREDARAEIVRRCAPDVERVLHRVLGPDSEIEDVAHEVFMAAFVSLGALRHPHALRSWLVSIAIRKARKLIRRRTRWRFVASVAPAELPEREAVAASAEVTEVSLATAKRRIARGQRRFLELARKSDILAPWLETEEREP